MTDRNMIVNIRGTSGSGKTHLVRELMAAMTDVGSIQNGGKVEGYRGHLRYPDIETRAGLVEDVHTISILGKYETACGGCDTIKTQAEILGRVSSYSTIGSVVFEGLLISVIFESYRQLASCWNTPYFTMEKHMVKALRRELETFPPFVFAFLDTPLNVCIDRVKARRLAAGNTKPLDETNTRAKWDTCRRVAEKFKEAGQPVVWLDYTDALSQLKVILKGAI